MAKILAYGDITITDITDVGTLSLYLTSSQPLMVVYDPNSASKYTPNWGSNNLIITPVITFNDQQLGLTSTGVSITWQRQAGSGTATDLVSGETVNGGKLVVSSNVLSAISSGMITYICNVSYTDPDTSVTVKTSSQLSYSLVKYAEELSDCSITGDTTFKYNGSGTLTSASSITLTANLTNTTLKQWQYKKTDGSFAVYPNSTTATTLTVKPSDAVFVNDVATIKLVTADSNVFDLHQIIKLRDGAAGASTYTCILSNDVQSVPCASNGTLYSSSLNGCDTVITILKGGNADTSNWNITATPSSGITGTFDNKTFKYTVTGITVDSGYVEFTATRSGYATITKRFTINKDRSGAAGKDAVIYQINPDVGFLKLNNSKVFVPTSVKFSIYKTVGNGTAALYAGRFKIYESTDGSTYTLKYTSGSDENSKSYTPSANTIKTIKCEAYESGNTSKLLDTQTVAVVLDGINGQTGAPGKDSINVVLGNPAEVIPCTTSGAAKEAKDITIPFDCYQGVKRIAGTATLPTTLPSGVTLKSNTAATASAGGTIVLTVAKNATLASTNSGDISITFSAGGVTSIHKFTWTKSIQASNGANAILFQIFAPNGDVILNNGNNVTLQTTLTNGTTTITSGITYQWAKYTGTYTNITNATYSSLTVTPSMVDSVTSFRCTATYGGKNYIAYWCVTDKTDPCTISCFSTLGTQLVNGQGVGALYALVFRGNTELDAIKSTTFSTTAPSNPDSGDFYYKIDASSKSVTLMKYNGTSWAAATGNDLPTATYSWYRRNSKGEAIDTTTAYATGKVLFLDKSIVDGKTSFTCKVEI